MWNEMYELNFQHSGGSQSLSKRQNDPKGLSHPNVKVWGEDQLAAALISRTDTPLKKSYDSYYHNPITITLV